MRMSNRRTLCNRLGRVRRQMARLNRQLVNSKVWFAQRGLADPERWNAINREIGELEAQAAKLSARIRAIPHQQEVDHAQR